MKKHVFVLIFVCVLYSCQSDKQLSNVDYKDVDLSEINPEHWDHFSKQALKKYKNDSEQASDSQKKRLSEILIAHDHTIQAIAILKQQDLSQSQYLTYLLAFALYNQGQLNEALSVIENNTTDRLDPSVVNLKLKILLELGKSENIIKLANFKSKHEVFSNNVSQYYLAMAYLQNIQCQKAIPIFNQVMEKDPKADKIYGPLASALQQCQRPLEAQAARNKQGNSTLQNSDEFYSRLIKNGDPASYTNGLLKTALEQNNTRMIIENSEKLLDLGLRDPTLLNNYAISLYQSQRLSSANDALFDALKLDPENTKSYQLLFEFNRIENPEIAENAIDELLNMEPQNELYQRAKNYLNEQKR